MRQRASKQSSDISKKVTDFGHGLYAFSQHLEQEVTELRRVIASKPQAGHAQMQHCLQNMMHRVSATGQELSTLEAKTVDAVSLELFQDNQARLRNLESYLQQYGYQPQEGQLAAESLLEFPDTTGVLELPLDSQPENAPLTSHSKQQAHETSVRQPFSQLAINCHGASPPVRQQALAGSQAVQSRYNSQSLSLERVTPTPSPVLSSSTDIPYSPSMRELQEKYGAVSLGSQGGSHRDSIESVSMPMPQLPAFASSDHLASQPDAMSTIHGQTTPYSHQQQLPPSLLMAKQEAGTIAAAAAAMAPAGLVSQDPGRAASSARPGQGAEACEEETTMCLRDQLISSRCTEQSTPEPLMGSPIGQADPLQRAAPVGSSCLLTPDHQNSAGQRPETPDTANLLQRALASSGSAVLSGLSLPDRTQQQQQPSSTEGAPADSLNTQQQQQQHHHSKGQTSCMGAQHQAATGQSSLGESMLSHSDQQRQATETVSAAEQQGAAKHQLPLGFAQQQSQHSVQSSAAQQFDGTAVQAAAAGVSSDMSLDCRTGPANAALQPEYVSAQEYASLGIMQKKHFTLEQLNTAMSSMHALTQNGGVFDADNLKSLKLSDHKTKTLLSSLTKLGKLRVQVVNGQITGYCMQI